MSAAQAHRLWKQRLGPGGGIALGDYLTHAVNTVPFYRRHAESIGGTGAGQELSAFPLVTRDTVASGAEDFWSKSFRRDECLIKTTSGTTGVPLTVPRDMASLYGFAMDVYRQILPWVPEWGEALGHGSRAVVLVNDNPDRAPAAEMNPTLDFRVVEKVVLGISPSADRRLVRYLRRERLPLLSGRPRALLRLAELDEEHGDGKIRAAALLTSGDNLHGDVRRALEAWFGVRVRNAYGSRECGLIGIECAEAHAMHLFESRVRAEVRREDGTVADVGSGELVLTNLENWAMPFVRYRTGDSATLEVGECRCGLVGHAISRLDGRDSVYFRFGSRRINPSVLNPVFESLPVRQFQVVQAPDTSLHVRWVPKDESVDGEATGAAIRERISTLVVRCAVRVQAVPVLAEPGRKLQRFVRCEEPARWGRDSAGRLIHDTHRVVARR